MMKEHAACRANLVDPVAIVLVPRPDISLVEAAVVPVPSDVQAHI